MPCASSFRDSAMLVDACARQLSPSLAGCHGGHKRVIVGLAWGSVSPTITILGHANVHLYWPRSTSCMRCPSARSFSVSGATRTCSAATRLRRSPRCGLHTSLRSLPTSLPDNPGDSVQPTFSRCQLTHGPLQTARAPQRHKAAIQYHAWPRGRRVFQMA